MSRWAFLIFALGIFNLVSACTPPQDEYPVSGEECSPDDPVKDIDARDLNCVPPV